LERPQSTAELVLRFSGLANQLVQGFAAQKSIERHGSQIFSREACFWHPQSRFHPGADCKKKDSARPKLPVKLLTGFGVSWAISVPGD
jgi:hypothetical protein